MILELVGADKLEASLAAAADDLGDLTTAGKAAADIVRLSAIPRVPVRTGRLAGSLTTAATPLGATVSTTVPYAWPVHSGVPALHMVGRPFLTAALEDTTDQVADAYLSAVEDIVDTIGAS